MAVLRWVSTSQGAHYASPMDFFQDAPELTDTWTADPALRAHLERLLPDDVLSRVGPGLAELGVAAATSLQALGERAESEQPRVEHYDPWGRRIDEIVVSDAWNALHGEQARLGLAAIPYEGEHGEHARLVQLAVLALVGDGGQAQPRLLAVQGVPGVRHDDLCLLYTSPSPRDVEESRMPSSA